MLERDVHTAGASLTFDQSQYTEDPGY